MSGSLQIRTTLFATAIGGNTAVCSTSFTGFEVARLAASKSFKPRGSPPTQEILGHPFTFTDFRSFWWDYEQL